MENLIKIINNRLDEQSLLGKESLTIDEFKTILEQVNNLVSNVETTEVMKDFCTEEQRETFNEIVNKITGTKKSYKHPNSVFYMVGDSVYMEQDLKTNDFYIRYYGFWRVFETKFDLNYYEISELLRGLLEHHLKCEVNTTRWSSWIAIKLLEHHLKCEVKTTFRRYFNRNT
jgi:hypothetical protein